MRIELIQTLIPIGLLRTQELFEHKVI